jgi:glycosyltransferase involved in cell wall biosynthesis
MHDQASLNLSDSRKPVIDVIKKELSIIIPTLNEEVHIGGVLDSIRENIEGRFRYEVIVVDNGSNDRTVEIAQKKEAKCLHAPGYSISSLRNLGASEACSDILVFLDADVYLGKDWGARIKPVMERLYGDHDIITGSHYGISEENNWIERIWFAPRTAQKEVNYINGGHLIVHRSQFARAGGFDPKMETGEDYEFCVRARRTGARIENDSDLKVVHAGYPKNIKSFFGRERWHARGDYKSLKTLASSKPALVCLANLCLTVACVIGTVIRPQLWYLFLLAYISLLTAVSLAASIHKNRGMINSSLIGTVFLYMVYFIARTISMVDIIVKLVVARKQTSAQSRS